MSEPSDLYTFLKRKVVEDPREATRIFIEEFNRGDAEIDDFLQLISRPPESRLRQLVANAVRNHNEKRRLVSYVRHWRGLETDEFTRRALEAFLAGIDVADATRPISQGGPDLGKSSEAYRYVSSRLRHKLRNAMLGVQMRAEERKDLALNGNHGMVAASSGRLADSINKIGRMLENSDAAPDYFANRVIHLETWIREMNTRYATEFSPINLTLQGMELPQCQIYGNNYLLETAFWNLWVNAQQAVSDACRIVVQCRIVADQIELTIVDNGPGFSQTDSEIAFIQQFSASGSANRGLGLLEIQDAVERLGGRIHLTRFANTDYRIVITLPLCRR
jgi:signal transduction histidine kinase